MAKRLYPCRVVAPLEFNQLPPKGLTLGATFTLQDGYIHGRADGLVGADIHLDMPTVTGTENILMAATLAQGETNIFNAAKEPEIVDLANYLRSLGAKTL